MTTIELKRNNIPTEPGWYLYRMPNGHQSLAEVTLAAWDREPELTVEPVGTTTIRLSNCDDSILWSDRLEIVQP